jgi:hypothetical protein
MELKLPSIFFSYSHADEALRDQLEKQLATLKRQGVIETWHDRRIGAGQEFDHVISQHVENDDIILLLVSPDFLASDYCYDREMLRAMERHEEGSAIVIPVILRACDWHHAPFGKLLAVPTDGKPVTQWTDRDQALLEVTRTVRGAVEQFARKDAMSATVSPTRTSAVFTPAPARSSNLRLARQFNDRDRDRFRLESFDYIARYFENSLDELSTRNPGVEGAFRRIDADRFTASIYRDGSAIARCTIYMGGRMFGSGICYIDGESTQDNGYNEMLSVEVDEHALFLRSMGMVMLARHGDADGKLSQEGAAELYWSMLIRPLQQRNTR